MSFGVFGKLPQKRDFVAHNVPRPVLEPFEIWLQSGVAASRNELGADWHQHYLVAPIWRFWIGSDILGTTCAGALMPSVDKVGRYFPLTLLYYAGPGETIAAPVFDPLDDWFTAVEARLLSALQDETEIEIERLAEGLGPPATLVRPPDPAPAQLRRGNYWASESPSAGALLASIITADYWSTCPSRSFWWRSGANGRGAAVYVRTALPDPFFYVDMIRGARD